MFCNEDADAVSVRPTIKPATTNDRQYFQEGKPQAGQRATVLTADFLNMLTDEFCNIVEAAGLTRDKKDDTQLLQAFRFFVREGFDGTGYVPTSRKISTNAPLKGGGDLSTDRSLDIDNATTEKRGVVVRATDAMAALGVDEECYINSKQLLGAVKNIGGTYNTRTAITISGDFVAPADGWYYITGIGAGAGGGKGGGDDNSAVQHRYGGEGGKKGGTTSFGAFVSAEGGDGGGGGGHSSSAGGGGAGRIESAYVYLKKGQIVPCVIGAGGPGGTQVSGDYYRGGDGEGLYGGRGGGYGGGGGAPGAGCGGEIPTTSGVSGSIPGPGGNGATTGTKFGNGGGGGGGAGTSGGGGAAYGGRAGGPGAADGVDGTYTGLIPGNGGDGGDGVIFIEFYQTA